MITLKQKNQSILVTLALGITILLLLTLGINTVKADATNFSDLKDGDTGYEEVMSLVNKEIVRGYDDKTFKPYDDISRQHIALMLSDALKLETPADVSKALASYDDVDENYYYAAEIAAVTEAGVFEGSQGSFSPTDSITREQMASVIVRAFELKENDNVVELTDVDSVSAVHQNNVIVLAQNVVTIGTEANDGTYYYDPYNTLKRVQFSILLDRAMHINRTIDSVTDSVVNIGGFDYEFSTDLAGIFNESNNDALTNAKITFNTTDGNVSKITVLQLNSGGTTDDPVVLDGNGDTINGNVSATEDNIVIQNVIITGDLTIRGEGFIGDGVTVEGDTVIEDAEISAASHTFSLAETNNSVTFRNSTLASVKVSRSGVQVSAEGETTIAEITVSQNATVTSEDGTVIPKLIITGDAEEVEINAEVADVEINTENEETTVTGSGDIGNIVVSGTGALHVNTTGTIANLEVSSADAKITIEPGTNIGNVTLPEGANIEDVIENYDEVKENITEIGGEPNPDVPPVRPPGGGGSGPVKKAMTVTPGTNSEIKVGDKITVTAPGADDLRIMLWATEIKSVDEAKGTYYDKKRVFSSRIADLQNGGMKIEKDNGVFTITIDQNFIDILEAGKRYENGQHPTGNNYDWSIGDATTWLITPETDDELWEEYETWDGEKVDDTLFVFKLGSTE